MGAGTELKITHTYRNSQELIDIAGGFVQKNASQIRKQLISPNGAVKKQPEKVRDSCKSESRIIFMWRNSCYVENYGKK